eukprot:COSAG05_NODE_3535_length_2005_cov_1.651626_2_plen_539_part_01
MRDISSDSDSDSSLDPEELASLGLAPTRKSQVKGTPPPAEKKAEISTPDSSSGKGVSKPSGSPKTGRAGLLGTPPRLPGGNEPTPSDISSVQPSTGSPPSQRARTPPTRANTPPKGPPSTLPLVQQPANSTRGNGDEAGSKHTEPPHPGPVERMIRSDSRRRTTGLGPTHEVVIFRAQGRDVEAGRGGRYVPTEHVTVLTPDPERKLPSRRTSYTQWGTRAMPKFQEFGSTNEDQKDESDDLHKQWHAAEDALRRRSKPQPDGATDELMTLEERLRVSAAAMADSAGEEQSRTDPEAPAEPTAPAENGANAGQGEAGFLSSFQFTHHARGSGPLAFTSASPGVVISRVARLSGSAPNTSSASEDDHYTGNRGGGTKPLVPTGDYARFLGLSGSPSPGGQRGKQKRRGAMPAGWARPDGVRLSGSASLGLGRPRSNCEGAEVLLRSEIVSSAKVAICCNSVMRRGTHTAKFVLRAGHPYIGVCRASFDPTTARSRGPTELEGLVGYGYFSLDGTGRHSGEWDEDWAQRAAAEAEAKAIAA